MDDQADYDHLVLERPEQFARRCNVSRSMVYNWLAAGMPSLKFTDTPRGGRRIDPKQAIEWLHRTYGDGA